MLLVMDSSAGNEGGTMAVFYCDDCDKYIDLDYDVEHYEQCPTTIV